MGACSFLSVCATPLCTQCACQKLSPRHIHIHLRNACASDSMPCIAFAPGSKSARVVFASSANPDDAASGADVSMAAGSTIAWRDGCLCALLPLPASALTDSRLLQRLPAAPGSLLSCLQQQNSYAATMPISPDTVLQYLQLKQANQPALTAALCALLHAAHFPQDAAAMHKLCVDITGLLARSGARRAHEAVAALQARPRCGATAPVRCAAPPASCTQCHNAPTC